MDTTELKYYKAIGKIQSCVSSAETFDDAIKQGLKTILENSMADYAVVWYVSKEDRNTLCPLYWICPIDLTSKKHAVGEGVVGRVYKSGEAEFIRDVGGYSETDVKQDFESLPVASVVCVPFSTDNTDLGCVEFIKTSEHGYFTDDEADVCKLLTMLTQIAISEDAPLPDSGKSNDVLISVKNITKSFENGDSILKVLKGVNFDIFKGEFLCLLGESGCGKSTMLNILGGLLDADGGSLKFSGTELVGLSQDGLTKFRRDNIGFVFQSYNLMPNLNSKQNLDLIAELVKNPMDSTEALKLVKMEDRANNYPSQLSGGQQQRVSIARAIVKNPQIILADEPTAALDYETSIGVLSVLEKIVKSGTTLVMVTHNEEITKMADRVIRFRNGRTYEITVNRRPLSAEDLSW